ncbi:MAG: hypothetical protein OQJ89_15275 [Kangiellaceae bacterium]|nr:hypothetical protein [Kangiellaceae bacterium]MCW9018332.1 hypothetical protein [Kangiellaceae bacterium]
MNTQTRNTKTQIIISSTIAATLTSLIACGGGSSSPASEQPNGSGNNPPDVVAGDFTTLTATVELAGMPNLFISGDVANNPDAYLNILIDANLDGVHSSGDLVLKLGVVEDAQTQERSLESALYQSNGPTLGVTFISNVDYQINNNEVMFTAQKSQSDLLDVISSQSQIQLSSVIASESGGNPSTDYLPTYDGFTQVQNNALITDPAGDYSGDNSVIDILEFRLDLSQ